MLQAAVGEGEHRAGRRQAAAAPPARCGRRRGGALRIGPDLPDMHLLGKKGRERAAQECGGALRPLGAAPHRGVVVEETKSRFYCTRNACTPRCRRPATGLATPALTSWLPTAQQGATGVMADGDDDKQPQPPIQAGEGTTPLPPPQRPNRWQTLLRPSVYKEEGVGLAVKVVIQGYSSSLGHQSSNWSGLFELINSGAAARNGGGCPYCIVASREAEAEQVS